MFILTPVTIIQVFMQDVRSIDKQYHKLKSLTDLLNILYQTEKQLQQIFIRNIVDYFICLISQPEVRESIKSPHRFVRKSIRKFENQMSFFNLPGHIRKNHFYKNDGANACISARVHASSKI